MQRKIVQMRIVLIVVLLYSFLGKGLYLGTPKVAADGSFCSIPQMSSFFSLSFLFSSFLFLLTRIRNFCSHELNLWFTSYQVKIENFCSLLHFNPTLGIPSHWWLVMTRNSEAFLATRKGSSISLRQWIVAKNNHIEWIPKAHERKGQLLRARKHVKAVQLRKSVVGSKNPLAHDVAPKPSNADILPEMRRLCEIILVFFQSHPQYQVKAMTMLTSPIPAIFHSQEQRKRVHHILPLATQFRA